MIIIMINKKLWLAFSVKSNTSQSVISIAYCHINLRGRSRTAATSKITKRSILDVAVALDPPLNLITFKKIVNVFFLKVLNLASPKVFIKSSKSVRAKLW